MWRIVICNQFYSVLQKAESLKIYFNLWRHIGSIVVETNKSHFKLPFFYYLPLMFHTDMFVGSLSYQYIL